VAYTIDWVCSKILNHGLNHGFFLSLFKFIYTLPHTLNCMCVSLFKFHIWILKKFLVLPKTAGSAQTHISISFIWIVWSTLYVCISLKNCIKYVRATLHKHRHLRKSLARHLCILCTSKGKYTYNLHVRHRTNMIIRRLIGSTDQADPSCFHFSISWILIERRWFYLFCPLGFLQGLRSLKHWLLQNLSIKILDQKFKILH
jgi:hypothetical protein